MNYTKFRYNNDYIRRFIELDKFEEMKNSTSWKEFFSSLNRISFDEEKYIEEIELMSSELQTNVMYINIILHAQTIIKHKCKNIFQNTNKYLHMQKYVVF